MENTILEKIIVRTFKLGDLVEVWKIDQEAYGNDCYPQFFFRQAYDIFGELFLIAETEDGEIVGYILGAIQNDDSIGWILAVTVKSAYWRRGIALKLTTSMLKLLFNKNVAKVLLTVDPDNNGAINLYRKLYFYEIDKIEDYFGPGKTKILMQKELDTI